MAIDIQLNRTDDNAAQSIYEFGPADVIVGSVAGCNGRSQNDRK